MDELRLLIQSRHPILYVETHEEKRLEDFLSQVARELNLALFSWSVTKGLFRNGKPQPVYETQDPDKVLDVDHEVAVGMEEVVVNGSRGHAVISVRRSISFAVRSTEVDTGFGRPAAIGVEHPHRERPHRTPVDTPPNFDLALLAAKGLEQTKFRESVLVSDIDDPFAIGRPARFEMVPVAERQLAEPPTS